MKNSIIDCKERSIPMNNFNRSMKEKLAIAATNFVRKLMKVDDALWVFINDGDMFKSINYSGMFQKDIFVIRYNRDWLKTAAHEKILMCAFHETFHAIQYSAVVGYELGMKENLFSDDEINQLTREFNAETYNDSNEMWSTYLVEQQAEGFAIELYTKYMEHFNKIDDFIDKYYDLYQNTE